MLCPVWLLAKMAGSHVFIKIQGSFAEMQGSFAECRALFLRCSRDIELFGGDAGLICRDVGLFCGVAVPFCGDVELFCVYLYICLTLCRLVCMILMPRTADFHVCLTPIPRTTALVLATCE